MPVIIPGSDCVLAEPIHVATQGALDNAIGIATLGWIIQVDDTPPLGTLVESGGLEKTIRSRGMVRSLIEMRTTRLVE